MYEKLCMEKKIGWQKLAPGCAWRVAQTLGDKMNATPKQESVPSRVAAMGRALYDPCCFSVVYAHSHDMHACFYFRMSVSRGGQGRSTVRAVNIGILTITELVYTSLKCCIIEVSNKIEMLFCDVFVMRLMPCVV